MAPVSNRYNPHQAAEVKFPGAWNLEKTPSGPGPLFLGVRNGKSIGKPHGSLKVKNSDCVSVARTLTHSERWSEAFSTCAFPVELCISVLSCSCGDFDNLHISNNRDKRPRKNTIPISDSSPFPRFSSGSSRILQSGCVATKLKSGQTQKMQRFFYSNFFTQPKNAKNVTHQ